MSTLYSVTSFFGKILQKNKYSDVRGCRAFQISRISTVTYDSTVDPSSDYRCYHTRDHVIVASEQDWRHPRVKTN